MAAETARMQRYQGVQKESAGYRLMTSMGWKEGEGLGAAKQGIKEHIKVRRNLENWGVGAVTAAQRARDWSTGMLDFHRVLSSLSEITSQHASRAEGEIPSDEDSDASGGEEDNDKSLVARKTKAFDTQNNEEDAKKRRKLSKAKKGSTKDKRKPMKKRKRTGGKYGDDEDDDGGSDAQQDANTGTVQHAATAAVPKSGGKRVKFATHLGRFKKRETAKMVKHYSQSDLAAILGTDPFAKAAKAMTVAEVELKRSPSPQSLSRDRQNSSSSEEDNVIGDEKPIVIGNLPFLAGTKDHSVQIQQPADEQLEKTSQEEQQWWSDYFAYAGRGGSGRENAKAVRHRGFSEQDQTDLYAAAQGGATQGRVGLGRSSMPKKVAGARWQGKKTKLGSDGDSDEPEGEEDAPPLSPRDLESKRLKDDKVVDKRGVVIVLPRGKTLKANGSGGDSIGNEAPAPGVEEDEALDLNGIKWKRVVVDVLGAQRGEMNLKAVIKKALAAKGLGKARKAEVRVAVMAAVQSSPKFAIDGKMVRLVSSIS